MRLNISKFCYIGLLQLPYLSDAQNRQTIQLSKILFWQWTVESFSTTFFLD